MRKSNFGDGAVAMVVDSRRGKRWDMTPSSTVCRSSTLNESNGNVRFLEKEEGNTESQVSSPMKAIYTFFVSIKLIRRDK